MGLTYAPSLILINKYFDSRRSFATGIASSGSGIGTFLLVPVIQFLFDIYGFTVRNTGHYKSNQNKRKKN